MHFNSISETMAVSEIPTCLKTCAFSAEYQNWTPIIGGIIITVAVALSVGYMVSRALNKRDWEAKIRMETYHLTIAVIWIMIILAVTNLTCSVSCSITHDENPFTTSTRYLNDLTGKFSSVFEELYTKARTIRIESSFSYAVSNIYYSSHAGCDNIAQVYENFAFMLSPFIASLIIQQYALILISQIAFTFLLPIGIVLRLIPGLKDSASYVIGIAFALYIVLPLTYVFAKQATEGLTITPISTDVGDCLSASDLQTILTDIGTLLPQAVFFPALSSIITIGGARAFAEIFKYDFAELRGE